MSERAEVPAPVQPWLKGWLEHKRRLHEKPPEPTPAQVEAASLRFEQEEIACQEWLERIANLSAEQIEALEKERDLNLLFLWRTSLRNVGGTP
jgi:hypothetical protein